MDARQRRCCRVAWAGLIPLLILFFCSLSSAAPLRLQIEDERVMLEAEAVPLIEILEAIAEKTGMSIQASNPLIEPITCSIEDVALDQVLVRLLEDWNRIVVYRQDGDGRSVPALLLVFGRRFHGSTPTTGGDSEVAKSLPLNEQNEPSWNAWLAQSLGDAENISAQVSAVPLNDDPERSGIKISRIAADSALAEIGIEEGDTVNDVNGQPVRTTDDLIQGLRTQVEGGLTTIRIERLKQDGSMDPIYLELR